MATARPKQTARNPIFERLWVYTIGSGLPPPGPPPVRFKVTSTGSYVHMQSELEPPSLKAIQRPPKGFTPEDLGEVNGIYDIICPELERKWSCKNFTLSLAQDEHFTWGAFDFRGISGIIKIRYRATIASPHGIPFTSLIKLALTGEIDEHDSPSDKMNSNIKFLGRGMIQGTLEFEGDVLFEGKRRANQDGPEKSVESMKKEWEAMEEQGL